jgi:hypothetical protein
MIEKGGEFVRELTEEEKRKLREKIEEARVDTTDKVPQRTVQLERDLAPSPLSNGGRKELRKQLREYYGKRLKKMADEAARREEAEKSWWRQLLHVIEFIMDIISIFQ